MSNQKANNYSGQLD